MHDTFQPFLSRVEIDHKTGNLIDPLQAHQYQIGRTDRSFSGPFYQRREPESITFSSPFNNEKQQAKIANPIGARKIEGPTVGRKLDEPIVNQKIDNPTVVRKIDDPSNGRKIDDPTSGRRNDSQPNRRIERSDRTISAREFNLSSLHSHRRDLPDATVYVPPGFDAAKPVNVVIYNHGRYNTASGDFKAKELKEQMASAPPNSILIVPAWQHDEGSNNNNVDPKFRKNVVDMVAHAVNQTGKTLDDIGSIQIVSHSAGYVPANIELAAFKTTPLYDRITSVANLDAHYGRQQQVDKWILYNIDKGRFASGQVSYLNVFNSHGSPKQVSMGQVDDVSRWAGNQRLVGRGYRDGRSTSDPRAGRFPIAFVEVSDGHGAIPNRHFKTALSRVPRSDDTKIGAR